MTEALPDSKKPRPISSDYPFLERKDREDIYNGGLENRSQALNERFTQPLTDSEFWKPVGTVVDELLDDKALDALGELHDRLQHESLQDVITQAVQTGNNDDLVSLHLLAGQINGAYNTSHGSDSFSALPSDKKEAVRLAQMIHLATQVGRWKILEKGADKRRSMSPQAKGKLRAELMQSKQKLLSSDDIPDSFREMFNPVLPEFTKEVSLAAETKQPAAKEKATASPDTKKTESDFWDAFEAAAEADPRSGGENSAEADGGSDSDKIIEGVRREGSKRLLRQKSSEFARKSELAPEIAKDETAAKTALYAHQNEVSIEGKEEYMWPPRKASGPENEKKESRKTGKTERKPFRAEAYSSYVVREQRSEPRITAALEDPDVLAQVLREGEGDGLVAVFGEDLFASDAVIADQEAGRVKQLINPTHLSDVKVERHLGVLRRYMLKGRLDFGSCERYARAGLEDTPPDHTRVAALNAIGARLMQLNDPGSRKDMYDADLKQRAAYRFGQMMVLSMAMLDAELHGGEWSDEVVQRRYGSFTRQMDNFDFPDAFRDRLRDAADALARGHSGLDLETPFMAIRRHASEDGAVSVLDDVPGREGTGSSSVLSDIGSGAPAAHDSIGIGSGSALDLGSDLDLETDMSSIDGSQLESAVESDASSSISPDESFVLTRLDDPDDEQNDDAQLIDLDEVPDHPVMVAPRPDANERRRRARKNPLSRLAGFFSRLAGF